jgi:hypothetical protein
MNEARDNHAHFGTYFIGQPLFFRYLILVALQSGIPPWSLTGDRHARPRHTRDVHPGSLIGWLKEACFVFARPAPNKHGGQDGK